MKEYSNIESTFMGTITIYEGVKNSFFRSLFDIINHFYEKLVIGKSKTYTIYDMKKYDTILKKILNDENYSINTNNLFIKLNHNKLYKVEKEINKILMNTRKNSKLNKIKNKQTTSIISQSKNTIDKNKEIEKIKTKFRNLGYSDDYINFLYNTTKNAIDNKLKNHPKVNNQYNKCKEKEYCKQ